MKYLLLVAGLAFASACQLPTAQSSVRVQPAARVHGANETVSFKGFEFRLLDVRAAASYEWIASQVESTTGFILAHVSSMNMGSRPVQHGLQPAFCLVDELGRVYDHSLQHSVQVNFPTTMSMDSMNPGVGREWTYVFEVPAQRYKLRVLAPSSATAGFMNETMNLRGPFFCYDLGLVE